MPLSAGQVPVFEIRLVKSWIVGLSKAGIRDGSEDSLNDG